METMDYDEMICEISDVLGAEFTKEQLEAQEQMKETKESNISMKEWLQKAEQEFAKNGESAKYRKYIKNAEQAENKETKENNDIQNMNLNTEISFGSSERERLNDELKRNKDKLQYYTKNYQKNVQDSKEGWIGLESAINESKSAIAYYEREISEIERKLSRVKD